MSAEVLRPRVLLAEGEDQARLALMRLLQEGDLTVLPVASAEEALGVLGAMLSIRAVITGVNLAPQGMTGLELARRVAEEHGIGCVVLAEQDTSVERLPAGVLVLGKPLHPPTLIYLVQHVLADHRPASQTAPPVLTISPTQTDTLGPEAEWTLTPRQQVVLELLMQGKSNSQIAQALGLSVNTVRAHLALIFRKLGTSSRAEAIIAGLRLRRPAVKTAPGAHVSEL